MITSWTQFTRSLTYNILILKMLLNCKFRSPKFLMLFVVVLSDWFILMKISQQSHRIEITALSYLFLFYLFIVQQIRNMLHQTGSPVMTKLLQIVV